MKSRREDATRLVRLPVFLLLLVAGLGLMRTGNAYWAQTLPLQTVVQTGIWQRVELEAGTCRPPENVACWVGPSATLNVRITNASPGGDYYCDNFAVRNAGTVPVKIQGILISALPGELAVVVTGIAPGVQIDPGQTGYGKVYAHVADSASPGGTYVFSVTVSATHWN